MTRSTDLATVAIVEDKGASERDDVVRPVVVVTLKIILHPSPSVSAHAYETCVQTG
jgi:hypothetical protein